MQDNERIKVYQLINNELIVLHGRMVLVEEVRLLTALFSIILSTKIAIHFCLKSFCLKVRVPV